MAKQRKLLYPSEPASFFDAMEEEMNSTRRKKCKRAEKVPPEKLFLQFDPNISKKRSNSHPLGTQKTQWKPPLKMPKQAENLEPCGSITSVTIVEDQENECSETIENVVEITPSNICNFEITDEYLEENTYKNLESNEDHLENSEVISIHSSQESVEQSPVKNTNDCEHNFSQHEGIKEMIHEILDLVQNMETVQAQYKEEDVSCQEESKIFGENQYMQNLTSGLECKFKKVTDPIVINSVSTVCEDPNPITYEGHVEHFSVATISNFNDKNNIKDSSDCLNNKKTTPKSETLKQELDLHFGEQINNTLNTNGHCDKTIDTSVDNFQISAAGSSKTIITNSEKSDESKIINTKTISEDKNGVLSRSESLKNETNKIQNANENETNDILIGSVFEASCPTETNSASFHEVLMDLGEGNENNLNVSSKISLIENPYVNTENAISTNQSPVINYKTIPLVYEDDKLDISNVVGEILEQETFDKVNKAESNPKKVEEDDANGNKEDSQLNSGCSLQQNNNIKENICVISNGTGEKENDNNTNEEFEKLLEVEKSINGDKTEIDEEYSCLMITNSQLEEIEKNYYESSGHTLVNEEKKISDNNLVKPNQILQKGDMTIECNFTKKETKFEEKNITFTQTRPGPGNLSHSFLQNILPTPQWSKNMLELQTKIRGLTQEIDQLNTLLMRARQTVWPQRHGGNLSAWDTK